MELFVLLAYLSLSSAYEHWFIFDQHQFPGFHSPLFTLKSSSNSDTNIQEYKKLSFVLSSYERSILIDVCHDNRSHGTGQDNQLIKLNIERADLLSNSLNHLIFIAIKQDNKVETFVNCKPIDSYIIYSPYSSNDDEVDDESSPFTVENLADGIQHLENSEDENYQQEVFDKFHCKQTTVIATTTSKTTIIGKPLIRKMQHVIEKVQKRKQRSRRHQNRKSSVELNSDSLTVIYKPTLGHEDDSESHFRTILDASKFGFHIRYFPNEHLFNIQFDNENRTSFILYADKSMDRVISQNKTTNDSASTSNLLSSVILFVHITPTMMTCYVNCELTDQEFIIDSLYVQNVIRQMMDKTIRNSQNERSGPIVYDRQSTLILFNKSIEEVANSFFCLKLDKKNEDLLPDKYTLRKFANALDILMNSLEVPPNVNYHQQQMPPDSTTTKASISVIDIQTVDGSSSLIDPTFINEVPTISSDIIEYEKSCLTDQDCSAISTAMTCQQKLCICPTRYFWSRFVHRCLPCQDLSIGNRCFRLSSHKSLWHEANEDCEQDGSSDDQVEYKMKLASNLNRTDIELLRRSLLQDGDSEQSDYYYWIGATSQFDSRKLPLLNSRNKRHVPTTIFHWYDNGQTAQLSIPDIWCSRVDKTYSTATHNNQLCVSLTSCGLYADDCQRNYRFLCEAV